jgi:ornithine cyclodeaminase/alanine dehydrogenase-like protein (mu-crystallin family)
MALLLKEEDVRALLIMPLALEAVEQSFQRLAEGSAVVHPRQRIHFSDSAFLHYMAAGDNAGGYLGLKIYTSVRGALRFVVPLFRARTGELVALIEADFLGQMRTGAASGVATKFMARANAKSVGIIGTGVQARAQLEAMARVRPVERVRAFGRNPEKRAQFCAEMTERLHLPVEAAASAEEAVRGADIVITATTALRPVVCGEWLAPGVHINAIGANFPQKRELDDAAVASADIIAVDSREQSMAEAGDLIQAFAGAQAMWNQVRELTDIVAGRARGRETDSQITLFKSNGIAIWDVAVAARVFELAEQQQRGTRIALWDHCG